MKKQIMALAIVLFLATTTTSAQSNVGSHEYQTALGVKFYPGAVTFKHFVKSDAALELIGYFWKRGTRVTGLYEYHGAIKGADGLKWYVGPGAHLGLYNNKYYGGGTAFGVDAILGLDYKIREAPINLSLDWQPSFEFGEYSGFNGNWGGFAIRYVF